MVEIRLIAMIVKPIKQKYSNDCAIAAVAMALHLPYRRVLRVAITKGFRPGGNNGGMVLATLFWALGYDFECRPRMMRNGFPNVMEAPRPMPVKMPCVVSIPSLNNRGGFHAVTVAHGRVFDPSPKRQASFEYVKRHARTWYYGFIRDA